MSESNFSDDEVDWIAMAEAAEANFSGQMASSAPISVVSPIYRGDCGDNNESQKEHAHDRIALLQQEQRLQGRKEQKGHHHQHHWGYSTPTVGYPVYAAESEFSVDGNINKDEAIQSGYLENHVQNHDEGFIEERFTPPEDLEYGVEQCSREQEFRPYGILTAGQDEDFSEYGFEEFGTPAREEIQYIDGGITEDLEAVPPQKLVESVGDNDREPAVFTPLKTSKQEQGVVDSAETDEQQGMSVAVSPLRREGEDDSQTSARESPKKRRKLFLEDAREIKPFVRPPFPAEVQPRPVVEGLSSSMLVKTCFRIGEAIKVAIVTNNNYHKSTDVLVELYGRPLTPLPRRPREKKTHIAVTNQRENIIARVSFSERIENRQNFQFLDLFHDRPPFLSGVFEFWKRCELWDADSAAFLGPMAAATHKPKISRIIGRMKRRDGNYWGTGFYMQILSIWEADWDDVLNLKRVICGADGS
jgi:hypothetical protein